MSTFLSNLRWRRAVKHFDTAGEAPVDVNPVIDAIINAPSCYGIQPYKMMIVENRELRERLLPHTYGQPQVTECDYLIVFMAYSNPLTRVSEYAQMKDIPQEMENMITGYVMTHEGLDWSSRQAYIALGFGLAACAEKRIASCPMEGFNPSEYKRILEIPSELEPVALLAVGKESSDPSATPYPRWRFPPSHLFVQPPVN
jgi:nitroreductase